MPALLLNSVQRSALRSEAHQVSPVVMIGDAGLTEPVLQEIDSSLKAHQLIKVRIFSDERTLRKEMMTQICDQLNAGPVQIIGKVLVIFRPVVAENNNIGGQGGKGERVVSVVKQGSHFYGKAIKRNVRVKGNERLTQSGQVKRAKKRVTSPKKTMG